METKEHNQEVLSDNIAGEKSEILISLFRSIKRNIRESLSEKFNMYGLTVPQVLLLMELQKNPNITLNELSSRLSLTKSTVSGIVDRLVNQGLVNRERPNDNRRTINISLTDYCIEKYNIKEIKENFLFDVIKHTKEEDVEDIIKGFEKFNKMIKSI